MSLKRGGGVWSQQPEKLLEALTCTPSSSPYSWRIRGASRKDGS